jgi:hypothetical protein
MLSLSTEVPGIPKKTALDMRRTGRLEEKEPNALLPIPSFFWGGCCVTKTTSPSDQLFFRSRLQLLAPFSRFFPHY